MDWGEKANGGGGLGCLWVGTILSSIRVGGIVCLGVNCRVFYLRRIVMLAEKFNVRTDQEGRLTGLPTFAANEEVEVIVLRKEPILAGSPLAYGDLEQAYREASAEADPAWEVTAGDGLDNEAW